MTKPSPKILLVAGDGDLRSRLSSTLEGKEAALTHIQRHPPEVAIASLYLHSRNIMDLQRTLTQVDPTNGFTILGGSARVENLVTSPSRAAFRSFDSSLHVGDLRPWSVTPWISEACRWKIKGCRIVLDTRN